MIKKQEKIDKFYLRALDEMFKRVGFDGYDREFTEQPFWYTKRNWTLEDDVNFTKWFIDEYRKTFRCAKYIAKEVASMFVFNYGWTIRKEFDKIEK